MTLSARRWIAVTGTALAVGSCSPDDPLDRALPIKRIEQDRIAETLPEPQRNHYRIYLSELRPRAGAFDLPTVREAIDAGRRRAEDQVREMTGMRAMLENHTDDVR